MVDPSGSDKYGPGPHEPCYSQSGVVPVIHGLLLTTAVINSHLGHTGFVDFLAQFKRPQQIALKSGRRNSPPEMLSHLPARSARRVCPLGEVGDGGDHPVVDLGEGQPTLRGTLDRLDKIKLGN